MRTIRVALVVLTAFVLTAIDAQSAAAETYRPWCVQYQGRDGAMTCIFSSREQCMMTATPGTGGFCVQNPWYLQYGPGGPSTETRGRGEPRRRAVDRRP
jgi:hypothetical protein